MNKGINVLSLFDGMSCARIALGKAGIEVGKYYSSEIDPYGITVANANYPQDTENRLGDVTKIEGWEMDDIDLLIGGSPCQGFSFAGKQAQFDDPRSALFFEYVRLVTELKPKYFLLENVRMSKESEQVISDLLGVSPVAINSVVFTPCDRKRLYWTNIPFDKNIQPMGLTLGDVVTMDNVEEITDRMDAKVVGTLAHTKAWGNVRTLEQVGRCLTVAGQGVSNSGCTNIKIGDKHYRPRPELAEIFQGVPQGFTNHVSKTQRNAMLGNGFTVDVIAHMLKGIKNV